MKIYKLDFPVLEQNNEPVKVLSVSVLANDALQSGFADDQNDCASQINDLYAIIDALESIVHKLSLSYSPKVKYSELS